MSGPPSAELFAVPPPAPTEPTGPAWPLWTVYLAGTVGGAAILVGSESGPAAQTPRLAAASVVAFVAFGIACAWLLNRIPYFRAVRRGTLVLAVLWGALAAAGFALLANLAVYNHLAARENSPDWTAFAPFTEEPLKDLGIVLVLLLAAPRPRTALDGLLVGSFVGLGFEVVENVLQSIANALASAPPGSPDNWGSLVTDVVHEVLRRSWTGHIVITGVAGFGIGYALTSRRSPALRATVAAGLVLLALGAHMLWNHHDGGALFGVLYVLGQFGGLGLYLWLIRVGRDLEAAVYVPYLPYAPFVDPALAAAMYSARARRGYRKTTPGRRARRQQRAVARLAGAIANGDVGAAHRSADELAAAT